MNIVFLRGAIPPKSEHPEKLIYGRIEDCEDMWTQLFYYLAQKLGANGELLYQGANREFVVSDTFVERWVPSLLKYAPKWKPDLIICRGGFPYYDDFVTRFPGALKVYYGAGKRSYPTTRYDAYDLFLVDAKAQLIDIRKKGKSATMFFKPAATMFKPSGEKKIFDVCFMANAAQARIKRHELFLRSFAGSRVKILNLGNTSKKLMRLAKQLKVNIEWGGWSLRKELPRAISRCRVGVCCSTNYDSCPRVIPEYLACGLPVVATRNMNFWHDKYITLETGALVANSGLLRGVEDMLLRKNLNVTRHYNRQLSMNAATAHLALVIGEIL